MTEKDLHHPPYDNMHDEEIVQNIKKGDLIALEYLINKYKNFVRSKANTYYLMGGDKEDIIQEGMIGLCQAIKDYDVKRLSSFVCFADTCITRQIITAIKKATRLKHMPLNSYISLNKPIYEGQSTRTLMDTLCGLENVDPEDLMISRECLQMIEIRLQSVLSEFEKKALMSYAEGMTYKEIADDLDRQVKSIDNALQRVKRKMEAYLTEIERINS